MSTVSLPNEIWSKILDFVDAPSTILSLLLINRHLYAQTLQQVQNYETRLLDHFAGEVSIETLRHSILHPPLSYKPSKTKVDKFFDGKYPNGLGLPSQLQGVGNTALVDALRKRRKHVTLELLSIDWSSIFQINLDTAVLCLIPFLVARTIMLSTTLALVRTVTRQSAAWLLLPLQDSSVIIAQVLSLDAKGAAYLIAKYRGITSFPETLNCYKLKEEDHTAVWYCLGNGDYGGVTWDWCVRWLIYLRDFAASETEGRPSIKHFRSLAKATDQSYFDVVKARRIARMPDSIGASVGAKFGMETFAITALGTFSPKNPGVHEYFANLSHLFSISSLPFSPPPVWPSEVKIHKLNYDVPSACSTLRSEEDDNSHFSGYVKDLFGGGIRLQVHDNGTLSVCLPQSTALGVNAETQKISGLPFSSETSYIKLRIVVDADLHGGFKAKLSPEDDDGDSTGASASPDEWQQKIIRRFLAQILLGCGRLDREIITPRMFKTKLGAELCEELPDYASEVIESRPLWKAAMRMQANPGSTGREVFPGNIACYTKNGAVSYVFNLDERRTPQVNGKRKNEIERLILRFDQVKAKKALRDGSLPPFPPAVKKGKNPPPIVGSITVAPPHMFNYGTQTFLDVTTLVSAVRKRSAKNTASAKIIDRIKLLQEFDRRRLATDLLKKTQPSLSKSDSKSKSSKSHKTSTTKPKTDYKPTPFLVIGTAPAASSKKVGVLGLRVTDDSATQQKLSFRPSSVAKPVLPTPSAALSPPPPPPPPPPPINKAPAKKVPGKAASTVSASLPANPPPAPLPATSSAQPLPPPSTPSTAQSKKRPAPDIVIDDSEEEDGDERDWDSSLRSRRRMRQDVVNEDALAKLKRQRVEKQEKLAKLDQERQLEEQQLAVENALVATLQYAGDSGGIGVDEDGHEEEKDDFMLDELDEDDDDEEEADETTLVEEEDSDEDMTFWEKVDGEWKKVD